MCDELRALDDVVRIYSVATRLTLSGRRSSPGATSRPAFWGVDVRESCGDGRKQEIPKRCHKHLEFKRFESVFPQKRLLLHLLLRVLCEFVGQAKWHTRR